MKHSILRILFVDDNKGDCDLANEALENIPDVSLSTAGDGEEALDYLRQRKDALQKPLPHLILLDLNMPRMGGLELLKAIKSDETLKVIPVIIFTSSTADDDVRCSYQSHANAYIVKPPTLDEFMSVIHEIQHFWKKVSATQTKQPLEEAI